MELRLEEEGLAWDEDRTDTLVTEPWYLGLGDASCRGKNQQGRGLNGQDCGTGLDVASSCHEVPRPGV